ncbi:hypothetical protein OL233_01655 [Vagococcus sp. PNs007]|uniref:Uncharacterized protein n=1 Tax=Vagococcus proximus TaxID=2991417 RepID=A0ABT5WYZ1_9ENTE|nr:hypothetical protein [Vagococcus proximus]MDF0478978.1 hypothetical protein [Vagococcus proximus]
MTGLIGIGGLIAGLVITSLFNLSVSLGFLGIVLLTLAALALTVFTFLFSVFNWPIKQTISETFYVVLSSSANAIILFILPLLMLVIFSKINLFFYMSLGFATTALVQIIFFKKVLGVEND